MNDPLVDNTPSISIDKEVQLFPTHCVNGNLVEHTPISVWKPRDPSEFSLPSFSKEGSMKITSIMSNTGINSGNSFGSVIQNFDKLKVAKKRGRPRKFTNRIVKAFQLPKRSKRKSAIKFKSSNLIIEAGRVLDSSLHMGLEPAGSKEETLADIVRQLRD